MYSKSSSSEFLAPRSPSRRDGINYLISRNPASASLHASYQDLTKSTSSSWMCRKELSWSTWILVWSKTVVVEEMCWAVERSHQKNDRETRSPPSRCVKNQTLLSLMTSRWRLSAYNLSSTSRPSHFYSYLTIHLGIHELPELRGKRYMATDQSKASPHPCSWTELVEIKHAH